MIEVRETEEQGRGYFAKGSGSGISAGTTVLEDTAIVAVVKDGQEDRTCRQEGKQERITVYRSPAGV